MKYSNKDLLAKVTKNLAINIRFVVIKTNLVCPKRFFVHFSKTLTFSHPFSLHFSINLPWYILTYFLDVTTVLHNFVGYARYPNSSYLCIFHCFELIAGVRQIFWWVFKAESLHVISLIVLSWLTYFISLFHSYITENLQFCQYEKET